MNKKYLWAVGAFLLVGAVASFLIGMNSFVRIDAAEARSEILTRIFCSDSTQLQALARVSGERTIDRDLISGFSEYRRAGPDSNLSFYIRCDYNSEPFLELNYGVVPR